MINSKNLKFIDFCSGIGAGRLGLELAGMECIAHSEINSDSDYTYNVFFNDNKNLGDLTTLNITNIPDVDLLIAGFPCQTFSIVGKRAGFNDNRGQIIYFLANILNQKKIPYFILENVKGLINHNNGNTLKEILKLLESNGYKLTYKVLNSENYGVPQSRERIYFVGIRKDLYYAPFEFLENTKLSYSIEDCLTNYNNEELDITNETFQKYLNNKYNNNRVNLSLLLKNDYNVIDTRQSDLRVYYRKCPTLRTGRHGLLYTKNGKLFKLTGIEALLLQGFPKEIAYKAKEIQNNKLLSQAGNAMTVNVIQLIGESLNKYIEARKDYYEFSSKRFANC